MKTRCIQHWILMSALAVVWSVYAQAGPSTTMKVNSTINVHIMSTTKHVSQVNETIWNNVTLDVEDEPDPGRLKETDNVAATFADIMTHDVESSSKTSLEDDMKEQTPPHVTEPLSQEMRIVTRDFEQINCVAEGNPIVSYTWYKDDIPLNEHGPYIKSYKNGSLHLIGFANRESGYFQCRAYNTHGASLSAKFQIFREIKPETPQPVNMPSYDIDEGEPFSLTCVTPPTLPEYNKRWYHKDRTTEVALDKRVDIDINGNLRFAYVTSLDSVTFRCGLIPVKDVNAIYLFNFLTIKVKPSSAVDRKPKLEFITKEVQGHVGKSLQMECFFSGRPVPNIEWIDNKNKIVDKLDDRFEISRFGHRLTIKQLQEVDEGEFKCKGTNTIGQQTETINVNVTSPPLRVTEPAPLSKTTVPDSKTVTLNCTARPAIGEQLDTPVWYRNGELFTKENLPDKERYSFNPSRTSLTIANLKIEEDTACYQCNISNSEGYLFYDGYLRVIESIKVKSPASVIQVMPNAGQIDLTVKATADPCCTLKYVMKLNGTEITSYGANNNHIVSYNGDCNLKMNINNKTDEWTNYMGDYTCEITNLYDGVSVSMKVVRYVPPEQGSQIVAEAGSNLWIILLVCGLLVLIIAVVIVVVIIKTNFPRNTYPLEKTELKHHLNPEEDLLNQSFQEI